MCISCIIDLPGCDMFVEMFLYSKMVVVTIAIKAQYILQIMLKMFFINVLQK